MKTVVDFLKKILLVIELAFVIAFIHWDKVLFLGIVALDQFTKALVINSMVPGESIPVVKNFFYLTYVLNPGAAFGIFSNQRMFLLVTAMLFIFMTIYLYPTFKKADIFLQLGATTILSGAVANLIDRIQTGYVVDFFDFKFWPVFNVADIAIVCGMGFMIYAILFRLDNSQDVERLRQ